MSWLNDSFDVSVGMEWSQVNHKFAERCLTVGLVLHPADLQVVFNDSPLLG